MTDSKKTSLAAKADLTKREVEMLVAMVLAAKDFQPQINWGKFTTYMGYKTIHSAQVSVVTLRKKLRALRAAGPDGNEQEAATAWTPINTPTPRKRKTATAESPSTPSRAQKRPKKQGKDFADGEDDEPRVKSEIEDEC
ncbi:hypothetical protein NKR23_g5236 [Pleurostoma richardsiae]|uniref:Uncharacterized protein n=1 Tax=Pleurostoma richardsiae TaxID=41990 RepID=A0AA38VF84_9PEZI|nr:hypothetical protein NKR23_g5236 [Pleurostoma richardsiae]